MKRTDLVAAFTDAIDECQPAALYKLRTLLPKSELERIAIARELSLHVSWILAARAIFGPKIDLDYALALMNDEYEIA